MAATATALVTAGSTDRVPVVPTVASNRVLAQPPYMGVTCGSPTGSGATGSGYPSWSGPVRGGHGRISAGFLQPAGLTTTLHVRPDAGPSGWLGSNAPNPEIRLWIDYGGGKVVATKLAGSLATGWG